MYVSWLLLPVIIVETGGNSQPELSNCVSAVVNKLFMYGTLTLNFNNEASVNVCY
jgi:hypothetical protein